jgi:uncharacterized protein (UPF0303 family)
MGLSEDMELVAFQERELRFASLDAKAVWELGTRFGQPLFYAALDGTTPDNAEWVRRKSNVVARFHRSSYAVGLSLKAKNETLFEAQGLPVADYAEHGGSFPLAVTGAGVVGSVTVSGLPQRADHELVVEALCAVLGKDYATLGLVPE